MLAQQAPLVLCDSVCTGRRALLTSRQPAPATRALQRQHSALVLSILTLLTLQSAEALSVNNSTHTAVQGATGGARGDHGAEATVSHVHGANSTSTMAKATSSFRWPRGAGTGSGNEQAHSVNSTHTAIRGGSSTRGSHGVQSHDASSTHAVIKGIISFGGARGAEMAGAPSLPGAQAHVTNSTHTSVSARIASWKGPHDAGTASASVWAGSRTAHSAQVANADHFSHKEFKGHSPSIGEVQRRKISLALAMGLDSCNQMLRELGHLRSVLITLFVLITLIWAARSFTTDMLITAFYALLYCTASPMAIMANKVLMKDKGFAYPVIISALGQATTAVCAIVVVYATGETLENGKRIGFRTLAVLGCISALALVLGQYPYFYLTVAFIQMLKAFSPAYMIVFLFCLGVESPSRRVIACVLGLCFFTAVASVGEVNFSLIGVLFMTAASCSDALRLVIAQKLLNNQKMATFEALVYVSPMCLLFMAPVALFKELPAIFATGVHQILLDYPHLFIASGFSGFFVNVTAFLLVKRTSSISLKLITMARNGGLVLVSALCFGETITLLEAIGYAGLLSFFGAYTVVKQQENDAAKQARADDSELAILKAEARTTTPKEEKVSELQVEKPYTRRVMTA